MKTKPINRLSPTHSENPIQDLRDLAYYLSGMADNSKNDATAERLDAASEWLLRASTHICGGGIFGCNGGPRCTSDHK